MIRHSSFCRPLGVLLVVCTVSRHCAVVLDSLPVHSLTMVVYVLVVMWGWVMVMVLRQYFQLSNCVGPAVQLKPGNIA